MNEEAVMRKGVRNILDGSLSADHRQFRDSQMDWLRMNALGVRAVP